MAFADTLKQLPPIADLAGLELLDASGHVVATIANQPGQAGSLAVYADLARRFGAITPQAAREGLALYAEHTDDAHRHPGKHPNIDRLIQLAEMLADRQAAEPASHAQSGLQVRLLPANPARP